MSPRQTFAIYCKTGVDVRNCDLSNDEISALFALPYTVARSILTHKK